MDNITSHWEYMLVFFYALEKIVKITPFKWDDILFDMIIGPLFKTFAREKNLKEPENDPSEKS